MGYSPEFYHDWYFIIPLRFFAPLRNSAIQPVIPQSYDGKR
jgi:hypothetical protein